MRGQAEADASGRVPDQDEAVVPWDALLGLIEPHYSVATRTRLRLASNLPDAELLLPCSMRQLSGFAWIKLRQPAYHRADRKRRPV